MTAAWMWARSELRARWRSWVILGLLAGATFGLAAAGWAGARRTSVALPNYVAAQPNVPDAAALVNDPTFEVPADLGFNRGAIADPQAFADDAGARSWVYLCGEESAARVA